MVEYGIVKFFDERDGKKFGFIRVVDIVHKETGEEIFFHFNDGKFVDFDDDAAVIFKGHSKVTDGRLTTLATPRRGDKIAFERKAGKEGKPKASPWTHYQEWESALGIATAIDFHDDDFHDYHPHDPQYEESCGYCGGPNPGINCACEEGDPLYGDMSGVLGPGLVRSGNV